MNILPDKDRLQIKDSYECVCGHQDRLNFNDDSHNILMHKVFFKIHVFLFYNTYVSIVSKFIYKTMLTSITSVSNYKIFFRNFFILFYKTFLLFSIILITPLYSLPLYSYLFCIFFLNQQ